jgi:hypothetical protein
MRERKRGWLIVGETGRFSKFKDVPRGPRSRYHARMNQRHDLSTTVLIHHAYVPCAGFEVPQPPVCKGKLESDPNSP